MNFVPEAPADEYDLRYDLSSVNRDVISEAPLGFEAQAKIVAEKSVRQPHPRFVRFN